MSRSDDAFMGKGALAEVKAEVGWRAGSERKAAVGVEDGGDGGEEVEEEELLVGAVGGPGGPDAEFVAVLVPVCDPLVTDSMGVQ